MKVVEAPLPGALAAALALNNAAVPAVNALEAAAFSGLCADGQLRIVDEGNLLGLCLVLPSGLNYDSLNYRWFTDRYDHFLYVDRVVVSPAAQGRGVGRLLYQDTLDLAREAGLPRVCSEVNVDPPNPGSMAFHVAMGFTPIHERINPSEGKTVAMMVHELA
ncbi:MAG: GNAT family N-acetyltransferase [Pseudomonadota bacterium]